MERKNGQTTDATGRRQKRRNQNGIGGLGQLEPDCQVYGIESVGTASGDRSERDSSRTDDATGNTSACKVLQRLELIEKKHIDYIKEQRAGLQTRLEEIDRHLSSFQKDVIDLKQEIYNLASTEEK